MPMIVRDAVGYFDEVLTGARYRDALERLQEYNKRKHVAWNAGKVLLEHFRSANAAPDCKEHRFACDCREALMAQAMATQRRLIDWRSQSDDGLRLRCGELTTQEIRSIRAVLNAILPVDVEATAPAWGIDQRIADLERRVGMIERMVNASPKRDEELVSTLTRAKDWISNEDVGEHWTENDVIAHSNLIKSLEQAIEKAIAI